MTRHSCGPHLYEVVKEADVVTRRSCGPHLYEVVKEADVDD